MCPREWVHSIFAVWIMDTPDFFKYHRDDKCLCLPCKIGIMRNPTISGNQNEINRYARTTTTAVELGTPNSVYNPTIVVSMTPTPPGIIKAIFPRSNGKP